MKPLILDTPGHEICERYGLIGGAPFLSHEIIHVGVDEKPRHEIYLHPIQRTSQELDKLAALIPKIRRFKHAKARQLRFCAKHP